jgi:hypothetical protein
MTARLDDLHQVISTAARVGFHRQKLDPSEAALGVAKFLKSEFHQHRIGPATLLTVAVKEPETFHQIPFGKLQEWLQGGAKARHAKTLRVLKQRKRSRTMKLTRLCLAVLATFPVPTLFGQQQPINCASGNFAYAWRLSITVTDSAPLPINTTSIDTVIDNSNRSGMPVIAKSGESIEGIAEASTVGTNWSSFSAPNPNGYGATTTCNLAFKSYSLLQSTDGTPFGTRITRYAVTIDPNTGNVTGSVQYESRDLGGNLTNVANGTFTGGLTGQIINVNSDPYFSAFQIPLCSSAFPANFVLFTSIYYVTKANSAGDRLIVGNTLQPGAPDPLVNWETIKSMPLPALFNQQFCGSVSLAAGYAVTAYVPTAAERNGDFNGFGVQLIDPTTNTPFPGNVIPASRLGGIFAWRVPSQPGLN